jgi:hypothetical protein
VEIQIWLIPCVQSILNSEDMVDGDHTRDVEDTVHAAVDQLFGMK